MSASPRSPGAQASRVRVGIGGWTYAPWRGPFYPAGLVQRRELEFASRALATIEINGTYYGAQKPQTYAKWREETPDGFVFSLKAPRYATERRVLAEAGRTIDGFVHGGLAELGDRLGPINWQFAPGKTFEPDDFAAFLDLLPNQVDGLTLRHAVEVRHPSFADRAFVDLARARGIAIVFSDSDAYPSIADPCTSFVYARLMRSRESEADGYPPDELHRWSDRLRQWTDGHVPADLPRLAETDPPVVARDVFAYFIGAAKVRNPAAAQALQRRVAPLDGAPA
jgi:uncharacterized protein YecE (DUF72 family)